MVGQHLRTESDCFAFPIARRSNPLNEICFVLQRDQVLPLLECRMQPDLAQFGNRNSNVACSLNRNGIPIETWT